MRKILNLKIEESLKIRFKAICALFSQNMQERIIELIEKDVKDRMAELKN